MDCLPSREHESSGVPFIVGEVLLRAENCEQGTLRCCGRTDKLYVGGILGGGIIMLR